MNDTYLGVQYKTGTLKIIYYVFQVGEKDPAIAYPQVIHINSYYNHRLQFHFLFLFPLKALLVTGFIIN